MELLWCTKEKWVKTAKRKACQACGIIILWYGYNKLYLEIYMTKVYVMQWCIFAFAQMLLLHLNLHVCYFLVVSCFIPLSLWKMLIFMTSQNPVTTAWALLNVHHLSEKPNPLIHDPDVVTKANRWESKQGKSRGSTFQIPATLWPCNDLFGGKNEQQRKEVVVLLVSDSSVCVMRPQEPCRSQDQLLCVIRSSFYWKSHDSPFLSH